MKAWHVKPYYTRRHRLMHFLRMHHYEQIKQRADTMHYSEMQKSLEVIDNLSKKLP